LCCFLQLQLLGHVGHHEGLADGLAAGDAERAVAVGILAIGLIHERLARHLFHGAQHGLIADPAPPQAELKHHLFGRFWDMAVSRARAGHSSRLARFAEQDG
jgi:hypothetical protein